jgi:hypothetical protein
MESHHIIARYLLTVLTTKQSETQWDEVGGDHSFFLIKVLFRSVPWFSSDTESDILEI